MKTRQFTSYLILVVLVSGLTKSASADGHVNPSFEDPSSAEKGKFKLVAEMPGWNTTDTVFEVWGTGFLGVEAHDGNQFVELNAHIDGTLYQDSPGIQADAVLEFSFAHRGRNGDDTMRLTITDLGADNALGGDNDTVLFAKNYTTGKDAWAVYDSTKESQIIAVGNAVRFAYTAIHGTGGRGPNKTEGNLLDSADFGVGVVTAKKRAYGAKRLHTFGISGAGSAHHYLGMRGNQVGIPDETNPSSGNIFVLNVEKKEGAAVLTNKAGKYLTARGRDVVLSDAPEAGSYWTIRDPLKRELHVDEGWFSLESANDSGRYLRHYGYKAFAHKNGEMNQSEATHFLADASWRFIDANGKHIEDALATSDRQFKTEEYYKEYTFRGSRGKTATIDLKSSEFDTYLWVEAPEGQDSDGDGKQDKFTNDDRVLPDTNSHIEYVLTRDGIYKVLVTSYKAGETGDYELRIASDSSAGQPIVHRGSLAEGDGTVNDGSFRDVYEFRGSKPGEKVTLDVKSDDFDTHLRLYDVQGNETLKDPVARNEDRRKRDKNSLLEIPTVDGEYRVRVTSHKPKETGRFELNITLDGTSASTVTPQQAKVLLVGQWIGNRAETAKHSPELNRSTDTSKFALTISNDDGGSEFFMERQVYLENKAAVEIYSGGLEKGEGENDYLLGNSNIKFLGDNRVLHKGVVYDRVEE